jgi:nucleoside-diphosphate-sugar epimerase
MMTTITLDIAEEVVERFGEERVKRMIVEALTLEAVKAGQLDTSELRRVLGFKTHKESREFLAANGIYKEVPADEFSADLDMMETRLNAEG